MKFEDVSILNSSTIDKLSNAIIKLTEKINTLTTSHNKLQNKVDYLEFELTKLNGLVEPDGLINNWKWHKKKCCGLQRGQIIKDMIMKR